MDQSQAAVPLPQPQNEPDEPARKRSKRSKYIGNACAQCKRRKIRCPGGRPCALCVAKTRYCTSSKDQSETSSRGTRDTASGSILASSKWPAQGIDAHEILTRLTSVEWQLNSVLSKEKTDATHDYKTPDQSTVTAVSDSVSPISRTMIIEQRESFVGGTSILDAFEEAEAFMDDVGLHSQHQSTASDPAPLTPKPYSTLEPSTEKDSRLWLRTILLSFGIVPEKEQWLKYLELYFDELHILFPFIHPPIVWDTFDNLWQSSLFLSSNDLSDKLKESEASVAVLFLCLANGRCAGSSRVDEADGRHSAGWSLYSLAMSLLSGVLDLTQDYPSSPVSIQALTLMVVYLFGLGANQMAEKTLAQAVSSAHILGLHRQITYKDMPLFEKEMCRRLWWSIYILDRRISLETGRPFLIQDINTNTEYPWDLSDNCLQHLRLFATLQDDSMADKSAGTAKAIPNNIPHLNAMIHYSKIVGDVWNVIYCDDCYSLDSRNIVDVYLEPLLEQAMKSMPPNLCYQPSISFEEQFSGMQWSQIKQSLLIYLRYTFLKLMMRKPPSAVFDGKYLGSHGMLANDAVCCELASSVAALFDAIPNQYPKVSFPFINYLANATMILFSTTTKNLEFKQAYQQAILSAVRTLIVACWKTWISGKLIRTISTLDKLTRSTLGPISDLPVPSTSYGKSSQPGRDAEPRFYRTEFKQVQSRPKQSTIATGSAKAFSLGTSMAILFLSTEPTTLSGASRTSSLQSCHRNFHVVHSGALLMETYRRTRYSIASWNDVNGTSTSASSPVTTTRVPAPATAAGSRIFIPHLFA